MESAQLVILAGLVIGLVYGAVGLLSGFCLMSSMRGFLAEGDGRLVRSYALAIAVAIAASQLLAGSGMVDLGKSIYPDIVVHQREIPNNLLAIEIRKASNHTPLEHDQHKLRALTDVHVWFPFWIGLLLVLDRHSVTMSEVYVSSALDEAQSRWFASRLQESGLAAS